MMLSKYRFIAITLIVRSNHLLLDLHLHTKTELFVDLIFNSLFICTLKHHF